MAVEVRDCLEETRPGHQRQQAKLAMLFQVLSLILANLPGSP